MVVYDLTRAPFIAVKDALNSAPFFLGSLAKQNTIVGEEGVTDTSSSSSNCRSMDFPFCLASLISALKPSAHKRKG